MKPSLPVFQRTAALLSAGAMTLVANLFADDKKPVLPDLEKPSALCDLFDETTLYRNDTANFLQRVDLIGRYEGQWHYADANRGEDSGWENRRWRLGARFDLLDDFHFFGQFNIKRDFSEATRLFDSVEDLRLEWRPQGNFWMNVGKIKLDLTQEYSVPSFKLITVERSLLIDQIRPDKVGGIVAGVNDVSGFDLTGGLVTGGRSEDWLLPEFDGGLGAFGSVGRQVSEATRLRLDYFNHDGDPGSDGFKKYEHTLSLNSTSIWDQAGLNTDLLYGEGFGATEDVHGLMLMPWYDLTDKTKLVFRYQYAGSTGSNGIRLDAHYQRPAVKDGGGDRGNQYHAFYLGVNHYLCGDKLKIMNGLEYSTLSGASDYSGSTFFSGVRLQF